MLVFNWRIILYRLFSELMEMSCLDLTIRTQWQSESTNTHKKLHTHYNSRRLTDRFRHMNTDTCPSVCQHIHTLRREHKASSLSVSASPPTAAKIVSFLPSLKQLIKMLWKRSSQSSPDAALPHWATIYLHEYFTAWHISASGFIYYWV